MSDGGASVRLFHPAVVDACVRALVYIRDTLIISFLTSLMCQTNVFRSIICCVFLNETKAALCRSTRPVAHR